MKRKTTLKQGNYTIKQLTEKLRYRWPQPTKPTKMDFVPYWTQPDANPGMDLVNEMAEAQIRVASLRAQITQLGAKPKGRTRVDLLTQLISIFLDPNRIARQMGTFDAKQQRFFTYLLLYTNLEHLQTEPVNLNKRFRFPKARKTMTEQVLQAGMGLTDALNHFFIPQETLSQLPPSYVDMESEPEPKHYIKAGDPQLLASRVQQWINLVQNHTYQLQSRPRWSPPHADHSVSRQEVKTWPLLPQDVKKIISGRYYQGHVTLCTPIPFPDAATLDEWTATLGLSPAMLEWLYHTMLHSGLLYDGSPVTVDEQMAQQWLTLTPGRQVAILYELYRSVGLWSDWWPEWRAGNIQVQWNFYNTWQLGNVDRMLSTTNYMLRWVLLDILSFMPHGVWLSVAKVNQWLTYLYPGSHTHLYQNGLNITSNQTWQNFMTLALKTMLNGALHEMGFVDLAPTRANPTHFRLHYLQDIHWRRFSELPVLDAQPLSAKTVTFIADKQMLQVVPPAPADFLMAMQKWSKPAGLSNNRLYYQLDVERLHNAFERGETPTTLAETWEANANFPPLQEITAWWHLWWSRYGHIRMYPHQTTLVTGDTFTMREIQLALPALRDAVLGLVTPSAALLEPDKVDRILKGLDRQGYMPQEDD